MALPPDRVNQPVGVEIPDQSKRKKQRKMIKADQTPSPFICLLFGFQVKLIGSFLCSFPLFQQVMVCVSALLTIPFLLADFLCPVIYMLLKIKQSYNLRDKASTFYAWT
jgi:hypothetical protein